MIRAALLALALAGCATASTTYNGHAMPAQCTDAALAAITTPVIEVDQIPYQLRQHYGTLGMWVQRPTGNVILLKSGQPPAQRAEVLKHERCHELMHRLTGDARWHGGDE